MSYEGTFCEILASPTLKNNRTPAHIIYQTILSDENLDVYQTLLWLLNTDIALQRSIKIIMSFTKVNADYK
jgi:hypothetical protein